MLKKVKMESCAKEVVNGIGFLWTEIPYRFSIDGELLRSMGLKTGVFGR